MTRVAWVLTDRSSRTAAFARFHPRSGFDAVKEPSRWRSTCHKTTDAAICCARGRPIIVEWERDARHSAGLSLVRFKQQYPKLEVGSVLELKTELELRAKSGSAVELKDTKCCMKERERVSHVRENKTFHFKERETSLWPSAAPAQAATVTCSEIYQLRPVYVSVRVNRPRQHRRYDFNTDNRKSKTNRRDPAALAPRRGEHVKVDLIPI
ncbi:hypothetical protein EVAR_96238_1 [Eumeta japonica]|uniref:Uncharacterized protein n=1 Tax=Eumeta variegata TaxID=151549 RepID=A0A4C1WMC9_EUMVA|nr:hypothetical protein EVAR_96238_1 [Eumeta japonica]